MKNKDVKKETEKKEKKHEPTNAEISMKALQGKGAYEDDEDEVLENEKSKPDRIEKRP
jgi:hypothetical protein